MKTIVTLGGEGIGPEVVDAAGALMLLVDRGGQATTKEFAPATLAALRNR